MYLDWLAVRSIGWMAVTCAESKSFIFLIFMYSLSIFNVMPPPALPNTSTIDLLIYFSSTTMIRHPRAKKRYCMDLVSLETQEKNNLIFRLIQTNDVPYIWTSGRLCDFKGCENRPDLEPKSLYGWFWSSGRQKM